jgi:hypothetical protein
MGVAHGSAQIILSLKQPPPDTSFAALAMPPRQCPLSGTKRKTSARREHFAFDPKRTSWFGSIEVALCRSRLLFFVGIPC